MARLLEQKYSKESMQWRRKTEALAEFVMKDCRPFAMIEGLGFQVCVCLRSKFICVFSPGLL